MRAWSDPGRRRQRSEPGQTDPQRRQQHLHNCQACQHGRQRDDAPPGPSDQRQGQEQQDRHGQSDTERSVRLERRHAEERGAGQVDFDAETGQNEPSQPSEDPRGNRSRRGCIASRVRTA
jgi:hypothetical protein